MKPLAFIVCTLVLASGSVLAQDSLTLQEYATADTIRVRKAGAARQFYYRSTRPLTTKGLASVLQANPASFALFQESKTARTVGDILGYAGGFLIGYPLGVAITGREPNWIMAGVGLGLAVVSIPVTGSGNRKLRQAVELFNNGVPRATALNRKPTLRFEAGPQGIGLALGF